MSSHFSLVRTNRRFVIDTTTFISYFHSHFVDAIPKLSHRARATVKMAFDEEGDFRMIIPSVVFVEVFDKWFRGARMADEEFRSKFRFEIFSRIEQNPQIEIREMDQEVLEVFLSLNDPMIRLENRDRFVLASAQLLNAALITSDRNIKKYVAKHGNIPELIT